MTSHLKRTTGGSAGTDDGRLARRRVVLAQRQSYGLSSSSGRVDGAWMRVAARGEFGRRVAARPGVSGDGKNSKKLRKTE